MAALFRATLVLALSFSSVALAADPPKGTTGTSTGTTGTTGTSTGTGTTGTSTGVGVSTDVGVGVTPMDSQNRPAVAEDLNDAQIYALLDASNTSTLESSRMLVNSTNADVARFAKANLDDATAARTAGQSWLKSSKTTAATSKLGDQWTTSGRTTLTEMQGLKGADLDRRYLDASIQSDQQLLTTIDTQLATRAKNPDLRKMLTDRRAKVEARLTEARRIQTAMNGNSSVNASGTTSGGMSGSTSTTTTGTTKTNQK